MPHKRSVSPPRSSNRTCGFPASGSPTGFMAGSRRCARIAAHARAQHAERAEHRIHADLPAAARRQLAAPGEKVAHAVIQMRLDLPVRGIVVKYEHHPRIKRFTVLCTSSQVPLLPGTRIALTFSFRRCTLFFDGLKTHQKSGSFPPPEVPGFNGTTTLSDSRVDQHLAALLRPLPPSSTGLPRLRAPLSRRAVPITPVDPFGCVCRLLPQTVLPSPTSGRVGVHNFPFEACSGFTRITARRFARPPKAAFVARLRPAQSPRKAARQLPD